MTLKRVILLALVAAAGACRQAPPPAPAAQSAAPQPAAALPSDLQTIVDAYRKIIVLMEDEPSLDAADKRRAELTGRMLFQENHQRLSTLGDQLMAALEPPGDQARVTAFLDALERNSELHDADKLAFRDIVADLVERARALDTPAARAVRTRLDEDHAALAQIQDLYNKELERIFGRLQTRGMDVRREAWDKYVAFLRSRFKTPDILREYGVEPEGVAVMRGGAPGESALETSGSRLPVRSLVLTFDDGPHPTRTDAILKILKDQQVPAVFFHVGQNVASWDQKDKVIPARAAAATRHLLADGHTLANHSYTHALLTKLSEQDIASQIERTNRALLDTVATKTPLFRPPYGARNEKVLAAIEARRMKSIMWNIDSKDWADPVPKSIANRVVQTVEGERRGIILFHDIQARTVEALPLILQTLKERGYQFLGWTGTEFAATDRGAPQVASVTPPAAPAALYRSSWAVVIGIDTYEKWPKLSYAVNDARAIQEQLVRKYGFKPENVTLLVNEQATRQKILSAIGDALSDPAKVGREDRVFIFFAGHGATRRLPNGRALGYIIPVEADVANYQGQAISLTNFQDISELIPAKHVLFVTDACYSGLAATRGGGMNYLQEVTRRMARQVLTAGGADEQVADNGPNGHSIFTWTVLQGLEGRADLNNDGFITASELASYVGPLVSSLSRQTPAFASLPGSEGGEFIFQVSHDSEFLSEESKQLDEEAIKLNTELDRLRASVAEKRARNEKLRQAVELAKAQGEGQAAPPQAAVVKKPVAADHKDRGLELYREKRYQEAVNAFTEAARLNPKDAEIANNIGFVYYKQGQYAPAIEWYQKTLAIDSRRAVAYSNLGDAYAASGKIADARQAYEKYLELQPNARNAASIREKLQKLPQ